MCFAERHWNSGLSPLGQLGKQSQDDQLTSPRSCSNCGQVLGWSHGFQTFQRRCFVSGCSSGVWFRRSEVGEHFSLLSLALWLLSSRVPGQGWQHVASLVVEERFVNTVVVPRAAPALPFELGRCGLRSATRTRVPAHWARWADSLRMIHSRHPEVSEDHGQVFVQSNRHRNATLQRRCVVPRRFASSRLFHSGVGKRSICSASCTGSLGPWRVGHSGEWVTA